MSVWHCYLPLGFIPGLTVIHCQTHTLTNFQMHTNPWTLAKWEYNPPGTSSLVGLISNLAALCLPHCSVGWNIKWWSEVDRRKSLKSFRGKKLLPACLGRVWEVYLPTCVSTKKQPQPKWNDLFQPIYWKRKITAAVVTGFLQAGFVER